MKNLKLYKKRYIHFETVQETERTLVYAILLETDGQETVALSELRLVKVILKKAPSKEPAALPTEFQPAVYPEKPIPSPYVGRFIPSLRIPAFSYARPPTI